MATRKENIDIEYDEPQQEPAGSNSPHESQDPSDWVPPMTVRIHPISKPRTKLLATASGSWMPRCSNTWSTACTACSAFPRPI